MTPRRNSEMDLFFTPVNGSISNGGNGDTSLDVPTSMSWQFPFKGAKCTWSSYSSATWSWGEDSGITSKGDRRYHLALDLKGDNNDILAAGSGTVEKAGFQSANGNYVIIATSISGKTVYQFYAHMASYTVKVGDAVKTGQKIGVKGSTGSACADNAPHLHFSIVDTLKNGSYDGYGYKNEFNGNIARHNDMTYYNPKFIIENGKLPG